MEIRTNKKPLPVKIRVFLFFEISPIKIELMNNQIIRSMQQHHLQSLSTLW